jgi:predicted anti-sigma-YlaC factor YlaD
MPTPQHGCRQAAQLISKGLDARLRPLEGLRLSWHLLLCDACRRFSRQSSLMREASARWRAYSEKD